MKISILFTLVMGVIFCQAQEKNSYYIGETGRPVYTVDSAVLIRTVAIEKNSSNRYPFVEYFLDKTVKKTGNSLTNNFRLRYIGDITSYDEAGKKTAVERFINGNLNGLATYYFQNGEVKKKVFYSYDDKKVRIEKVIALNDSLGYHFLDTAGTGIYKVTNEYGELIEEEYLNGDRNGNWKVYNPKSKETYLATYQEGKFLKSSVINAKGKTAHYSQDEVLPTFKGGMTAFSYYLSRELKSPKIAKDNGTQGRVFVRFIVGRDGSITDCKVIKGIGDGCDEEALRVIANSPRWNPGIQKGMPVRVSYTLPISFQLTNSISSPPAISQKSRFDPF